MALSDRDIIIVPSRGTSVEPVTTYRGGDAASSGTITLRVINSGTSAILSFEGNTGQLLSISDVPSSTVFSANDISGVPSIEVLDSGQVKLAEYNGFVTVGGIYNQENATSTSTGELRVTGGMSVWKDIFVGGTITAANFSGTINNATNVAVTDASSDGTTHYPILATGTSGNLGLRADSSLQYIPSTNRLGIGTTPSYSLDVAAQTNPFQTVARFGSGGSDILITHASAIISHNASYNGGWTRTGSGKPTQIELQGGIFNVQNSVTSGAGGSSITDWVSRLYIENDGDVGIGTTTPSYKLHVTGDIYANGGWLRVSGTNGLYFESYAGGWFMQDGTWIRTYNSKSVWTDSGLLGTGGGLTSGYGGASPPSGGAIIAGNVGIGTSSPGNSLHVYNASNPHIRVQAGGGNYSYLRLDDNSTNGYLIKNLSSDTANGALAGALYTYTDNNKAFQHIHSGTPLFTILSGGNTGIGTTNPINKLQIVGGNTTIGISDGASTNRGRFFWQTTTNYAGIGLFNDDNSNLMFGTTAAERMRITAGGNVGINTISPGRTFDVDGVSNFRSHIAQTIDHSRPNVQWGASGTATGAVIIYLPGNTGNYGMIHAVIDVYTYDGENASTIIVGGHNWNSAWYNFGATKVGNFSKGVRVGVKNGQYCIVLGTNTSTWSYGQVRVRKIQNGSYYTGIMDLSGSYTITLDASAESYTYISGNLTAGGSSGWNSGNDGAGSGLDADLLDGIDSTSFVRDDAVSNGYIQLDGGTQNAPQDATLYVTATNNNDWGFRLNKYNGSASEYGMQIEMGSGATYAMRVLGNGSETFRVNGAGYMYSPIFYDINDTSYYTDPNGFSQNKWLRLLGDWGASGVHLETFTIRGTYPSITLRATNGNLAYWLFHNDSTALYFYGGRGATDGSNWDWGFRIYGNSDGLYGEGRNSLRAPIFYDSNDTGYYADPNSISRFYGLAIRGDASSTDTSNQIFFWGSGNSTTSAIGFKANGGYFTNPTGNGDGYNTYLTMDSDGRGWVFRRGVGGSDFGAAYTSGWILNNGIWQANASMRAPIFYDSNNTAYYLDPAGTSVLNIIQTNSSITTNNSMYAPIYYDSNDSNYWVDPNSISKVNMMQAENLGGAVMNRVTSNIGISGSGVNEAITFIDGTTVQAHVSTGTGNSGACYNWYTTEWIYVDPEKDYEFSYWVRSTGNDAIYFGWHELNSAGNYISSNPYFSGGAINTNGTWVKRVALLRNWRTPSGQANNDGTDRYASTTSRNSGPDVQDGVMHSNTRRVHLRFGTCYGSVSGSKTYFHLASIREVTGHDRQAQTITMPYFNGSNWQGSLNLRSRTHWENYSGIDIIGGAGEFRMSSDTGNLNLRVDGWMYANDSSYFPFIYDQQDTAYYVDPNSTSRLNTISNYRFQDGDGTFLFRPATGSGVTRSINLADSTGDPSSVGGATLNGITWGQRGDSSPYYIIHVRNGENYNGNYTKLTLAWHTGIHIGADPTYGGTNFYNQSPGVGGSRIFSVGRGDSNVRADNALYSPIYYDLNDSGFYADPNSISRFNQLRLVSTAAHYYSGTSEIQFIRDGSSGSVTFDFQEQGSTSDSDSYGVMYLSRLNHTTGHNSGANLYFRSKGSNGALYEWAGLGGLQTSAGAYSGRMNFWVYSRNNIGYYTSSGWYLPIIYDQNDSSYYLDPNSTTNIKYLKVNTDGSSSGTRALTIRAVGQAEINFGSYPGNWTSALQIQNNNNTDFVWISPLDDGTNARFRTGGSGLDFYTDGGNDTGTYSAFIGSGSVRSPIFYDLNDTNYYVDPNSISKLQYIDSINYADFREANNAYLDWEYSGLSINPTSVNSYADGSWTIASTSYDWNRGILSNRRFRRIEGLTLEWEAYSESSYVGNVWWMMGFIGGSSTSYSYCQTPANLLYQSAGGTTAYDNCSYQGTNYNVNTYNTWTKFRVVLKSQGALYYVHWNGAWQLIVETSNNDASNNEYVRIVCSMYAGRVYFRNISVFHQEGFYRGNHFDHNVNMRSLGVGTTPSNTQGEIRATNEVTAYYSDRRLKTNIAPITDALEKVNKLNGVTYNANDVAASFGYDVNKRHAGLLADEVESVLPEVVRAAPFDLDEQGNSKTGNNYKTVQYEKLVPLLVEAIKEQQQSIELLKNEIKELKGRLGNS